MTEQQIWRVVLRGHLSDHTLGRLATEGITRCGAPFATGPFRSGTEDVLSHPLRVAARDADHAFMRVSNALGEIANVRETPSLMTDAPLERGA